MPEWLQDETELLTDRDREAQCHAAFTQREVASRESSVAVGKVPNCKTDGEQEGHHKYWQAQGIA